MAAATIAVVDVAGGGHVELKRLSGEQYRDMKNSRCPCSHVQSPVRRTGRNRSRCRRFRCRSPRTAAGCRWSRHSRYRRQLPSQVSKVAPTRNHVQDRTIVEIEKQQLFVKLSRKHCATSTPQMHRTADRIPPDIPTQHATHLYPTISSLFASISLLFLLSPPPPPTSTLTRLSKAGEHASAALPLLPLSFCTPEKKNPK